MVASASRPMLAGPADERSVTWRQDGAMAWFMAAVSLVLAANLWLTRYLWPDAFYDLYVGRYIAAHGLPHGNVFTVTSHGAPWVDQQWLAHLSYYAVYAVGGYPALVALSSALVAGGFAVLALTMLRRGVPPARMFAWTIAAFIVSLGNTEVRAQSFGYLFLALTIWLIVEDSRAVRMLGRTWLIIPVLVLWANTYGSVLLGAGLVVLYAGYRAVAARRYVALAALAAVSPFCTPYGLAIVSYYHQFVASPIVARFDPQWRPPGLDSPLNWAFFGLIGATAAAVAGGWRRGARPDVVLTALAVVLLALALRTYKDLAWFGYAGALLAADTMTRARTQRTEAPQSGFRQVVAGVLGASAVLACGVLAATPDPVFLSLLPWRAIDVAVRLAGSDTRVHVLTDKSTGSTLLGLHPGMLGRAGFDIRVEQYTAAELSALYAFLDVAGPRWKRAMRGYDVIVVDRFIYPRVAAKLYALPGWRVVYSDRYGIVAQRGALPGSVIARAAG